MTDYELADSFNSLFMGMHGIFTSYVSILFAFLIASWLVAPKLNRVLMVTSIGIFTLVSVYFMSLTFILAQDLTSLMEFMKSRIDTGESSLGWVSFNDLEETPPLLGLLFTIEVLAYIGSLIFFFYQRKTGKASVNFQ